MIGDGDGDSFLLGHTHGKDDEIGAGFLGERDIVGDRQEAVLQ